GGGGVVLLGELQDEEVAGGVGEEGVLADIVEPARLGRLTTATPAPFAGGGSGFGGGRLGCACFRRFFMGARLAAPVMGCRHGMHLTGICLKRKVRAKTAPESFLTGLMYPILYTAPRQKESG